MAFNGSGVFNRIYTWVTDKVNGIPITASRMDAEMDGMATGLSSCITRDGQTTITANIPMASHKFTGLSVGNARTDSITIGQVQDGQFTDLGTTGGAADAYTANPAPIITAYVASQEYTAKIHTPNLTTTPYLQISGIATPASTAVIKKLDASGAEIAVEAGDLVGIHKFKRNAANNAHIVLNPQKPYINIANALLDGNAVNNLGLACSVGASALTISLKTKAGTDPAGGDQVKISFRNATPSTGTYNIRSSAAATSLVISSGSTLGTVSGVESYLFVYVIDNAGTIELGVSSKLFDEGLIASSTAEGGAGGADSSSILYSTTARSNVPIRLIGRLTVTEATAGTWATTPSVITLLPSIIATNVSLATTGYEIRPSGVVEQWGITGSLSPDTDNTITFPIPFLTACVNVVTSISAIIGPNEEISPPVADTYTASNFNLRNTDVDTTVVFSWRAIGS